MPLDEGTEKGKEINRTTLLRQIAEYVGQMDTIWQQSEEHFERKLDNIKDDLETENFEKKLGDLSQKIDELQKLAKTIERLDPSDSVALQNGAREFQGLKVTIDLLVAEFTPRQ